MLLMSQTINGLEIASDTLIFLLQDLGFVINLQKSVLVPLEKVEFLGLEIDSVRMTLTLPQEKVKKIETDMSKAYFKAQNYTMGSEQRCRFSLLDITDSATSYATNQVLIATATSSDKK